jgi:hypothetical protein
MSFMFPESKNPDGYYSAANAPGSLYFAAAKILRQLIRGLNAPGTRYRGMSGVQSSVHPRSNAKRVPANSVYLRIFEYRNITI